MAFPTLKYQGIEETREQNHISSTPQDGKVITRKKFTKTRKQFMLTLPLLSLTDVGLLMTHYDEVEMVSSFSWAHPNAASTYTVRYSEPITYKESAVTPSLYSVNPIKLVEV